jgi:FkbM family methyltransferase
VQISVLDELTLPPPTVIKIDVEGFEWEVLNGGN